VQLLERERVGELTPEQYARLRQIEAGLRTAGVPNVEICGREPLIHEPLVWEGKTFSRLLMPFDQHPLVLAGNTDWIPESKAQEVKNALAYLDQNRITIRGVFVVDEAPKDLPAYYKQHGTLPPTMDKVLAPRPFQPRLWRQLVHWAAMTILAVVAAVVVIGVVIACVVMMAMAVGALGLIHGLAEGDPAILVAIDAGGEDPELVTYVCVARWDHPVVKTLRAA